MPQSNNIGLPIRRFFEDHLVSQRGLSPNTVLSYRDTFKLFLQFAVEHCRKSCTDLIVDDLTAQLSGNSWNTLERNRKNGTGTRNVRLAAIHAFFRYLAATDPRYIAQCQAILAVPFKRHARHVLGYLEKEEVLHIFRHIDVQKSRGGGMMHCCVFSTTAEHGHRKLWISTSTISVSAAHTMC